MAQITLKHRSDLLKKLNLQPLYRRTTRGLTSWPSRFVSKSCSAFSARAIVKFAAAHSEPLIVATDLNAGDQTMAYAIVTGALADTWREAGWGFGHTFPGGTSPGLVGLFTGGVPIPMWLVRIDYVFHSRHWRAVSARVGPWDGVSDHRPVVAQLTLTR